MARTAALPSLFSCRSVLKMKYVRTFVRFNGPPCVRMSIWPKVWKAKIDPTTTAKKIVGDSSGSVTRKNRRVGPAPSICAAS